MARALSATPAKVRAGATQAFGPAWCGIPNCAHLFRELWSSYRKALPIEALSESDIALIRNSRVETDQPYDLEDIPEIEEENTPPRRGA